MEISENIVIVGAGVAGLTTSLALHRLGLSSLVLESSDSLRVSGYGLIISANAWRALDAVGVGDTLRQHHPQLQGLQLTPSQSSVPTAIIPFQGEGKCGSQEVRCVKRKSLLENLEKELPPDTIRISSEVVSIQESRFFKLLHLADGSVIKAKVLIGCDGVNSVVAKWLDLPTPIYTQQISTRGLAEFPNGHELQPMLFQHFGEGIRYAYVPCDETKVYWFLTLGSCQAKEDLKNNPSNIKQFVLDKLESISAVSNEIIEKTELDNFSMCSIKVRWPLDILSGNMHKGNVCVVGDAFHPMTPDIGQGACSAIEDAVILARCLADALKPEETEEGWYGRAEKGLEKYAKERRWRSFMIATTSYLIGKLQQSNGMVINFLKKKILLRMLMSAQLKIADFDCGRLHQV